MTVEQALAVLLKDTGLVARSTGARTWSVIPAGNVATPTADSAAYRPDEIVVTAQKRVESVPDVPLAVSAPSHRPSRAAKPARFSARSEERRVGQGCVSTSRSLWSPCR